MPLSVECPECGARYNVPDKLAGKKARCKKCGATIPIPGGAAPAETPIGFAAEDDPMSALQSLARASGEDEGPAPDVAPAPAAPRRRPGAVPTIPSDWTPESVIVEKEAPAAARASEGSGRWARKSDSGLVKKLVWLVVLGGLVAGGWYAYTNYSGRAAGLIASATDKLKGGDKKPATESPAPPRPAPAPSDNEKKRSESADHLHRIFAAVSTKASANGWTWPAELATLEGDGTLAAADAKSPFGPAFASADYVYKPYVAAAPAGPDVVLAYDNAEYSTGEGASVLFGSGEVRWLDKAAVDAALQQSEQARATAVQRQQAVARNQSPQQGGLTSAFDAGNSQGGVSTGVPNPNAGRVPARGDLADRIKASSQGLVADALDVAVRKGTEQVIRPAGQSPFVALLVTDGQSDTVEVFDGKSSDPVQSAQFPAEQQFRNNPGAYALSGDGKLLAHLVTFPKLRVSVYSFEKKSEAATIDLTVPRAGANPTIVGFLANDRLLVRWALGFEHGLEVWDIKTARRGKQINLFRLHPQPSPGSETVSPDGKTYAVLNKTVANTGPRTPAAAAAQQGMAVLLYDVVAGGPQPRRFLVPVLNDTPGVQALGLSFSPDKSKLAILLADPQGRGVVVTWPTNTGKPLPEKVLAEKVDFVRAGLHRPHLLDWLADGRALLAAGRLVLNADTGDTLAILDAGKIHAQAVTAESTLFLAHGDYATLEGLAVVTLNEAKLPEKPGQPNRASAAPAR
jgi:predicted Zn finger-like uncharacterized protein